MCRPRKDIVKVTFTGKRLTGIGDDIPATCIVRNEVNGWRRSDQVVRTTPGTAPDRPGVAYMPRPFPPGAWTVTGVYSMSKDSVFWPYFIDTDAHQVLSVWETNADGTYGRPTRETFEGVGYGIHHARYNDRRGLVRSNTTLGCINILDPTDAERLAQDIKAIRSRGTDVVFLIPSWSTWEV